ncbi:TetR/AcrR family transcriptional regulator [Streptomyces griseorubiginosus]|uniref:TetR/AcrR family transcriptional regulator n=1 Tax=Streptomyces griseorubiginosus TaxID=67304 RepID=UPI001AD6F495|nr:TetR/AcrR family transcriptional regulator [Streptomyces griseorubiginosus]MBO4256659.1 TetR family transcriptional regulator [Streptomyces griseorubiginosus]
MTAQPWESRQPARARVLETATRLFYTEGIHSVGIDRIIAEAGVAKATFYRHFPSKDDLVRAYVVEQSSWQRAAVAGMPTASPRAKLEAIFTLMCDFGAGPDYRGCAFVNAAAEYPDPAHPVRQAIADHRRWLRDLYRELLTGEGHPDAERTADMLMLLRDGLSVGLDLDDPVRVRAAVEETLAAVLGRGSAMSEQGTTAGRR